MKITKSKELLALAKLLTLQKPSLSIVPDTEDYPWFIKEFQRQLVALETRKKLMLPNLQDHNESIGIFSDYGGESPASKYFTYSFLVFAWNQTDPFTQSMTELRKKFGLNEPFKEIAFKDFRYGPIKRSLPTYLRNLSNFLNGFLLTVVVEKSVGSVFGDDTRKTHGFITQTLQEHGHGDWKPEVAEKLLRITHFSAYLVALLSKEGQKVFWMTDHDAIGANEERFNQALNLFSNLLNHYCKHKLSLIGGALPFKETSPMCLDILSASDIVAGAVEHYFSRTHGGNLDALISGDANEVLRWLSGQGVALKRHAMIIRSQGEGMVSGTLQFSLNEQNPEAIFVPVPMN